MPEILYLRLFVLRSELWQDLNVNIVKKNLKKIILNGFLLLYFIGLAREKLSVLIAAIGLI